MPRLATRAGALDAVESAVVRALASLGAVGITQRERVAAGQRVQEQRALDSRVVLEQAEGVLAERCRVPPTRRSPGCGRRRAGSGGGCTTWRARSSTARPVHPVRRERMDRDGPGTCAA
ncbi:hypothetical protein MO973_10065 [Paenibacillus sp. TRM 82003]|uniref:hypothetical protein n=1 Tax=Kineococcus sp. TRM81007 TaxID=2925831 RepID=UPI001F5A9A32|nr:hypothetical protein [Kineococcus sp. TRM81007]MCI2238193.1 hypothetical protein [Kineococcus sp. TRM81007]MCI3920577.1 hypothetical protein [Paenibacillus sp. TRM 82003]